MRSTKWRFFSCWLIIVGLLCPPVVAADVPLLRQGHRGPEVVVLQDLLASLGYLSGEVDGIFGPNTKRSVVNFQKDEGLVSDGIVGVQTWRRLQAKAPVRDPELVLWEEVDLLFPHGSAATIVDLVTGRSLQVRRYHGHLHADVEPLTAADTKVLKSLYGGCFSWERRAVALEIGGRRIAASMNGFPHGSGISIIMV